ncbi:MAG TPA: hypothetical protein VH331_15410 [Allosphingosinicella sp.]|jgi:hypothetical protein|nr:hypothetical protein [Allosphingosinicella sp.]
MKKTTIVLLVSVFAAAPAFAQAGFSGTWKADLASVQTPQKPDVFMIKDGVYTCRSCVPAYTIKADGAFHPITGHPYYDEEAVKVVDARTVEFASRLKGKVVGRGTDTVSADGHALTFAFTDTSSPNGQVVTGKGIEHRVGPAPARTHAISGSWRTDKYDNVSDAGLLVSYKLVGDMLQMTTPTGQSYQAKVGGGAVLIHGDQAATMASIRRLGPTTLQEVDTRAGKPVGITTMTLNKDGKTMSVVYEDKVQATRMAYKAVRQ